jgi:FkbH-like protein
VTAIPAGQISSLFTDPRFQGSTSAESRTRRQFYQEAAVREAACAEYGSDYLGFLASCKMSLEIAPYAHQDSERVSELVQRTNQFNFSGRKHTRGQLEELIEDPHTEKMLLRGSDRYGSYGVVGFAIVEPSAEAIRIHEFMLSCRVQGKLLEQAFFSHLFEHHNAAGAEHLWINFHATDRNKPAQQLLKSLGFRECVPPADSLPPGVLRSSLDTLRCDFIEVRCLAVNDPSRPDNSRYAQTPGAEQALKVAGTT